MSVSSLPEWKQLLLEKKRREEEERERREKEEEEKLASMPAWKRGIIQRRRAKQENVGDREKERDVCLLQVDVRFPSDGLSDTDSSVTINMGSELSFSPDPGKWLDADTKSVNQVSVETIVPLHENPFIRTQSAQRKVKDADGWNEAEIREREKDKSSPRGQDGELGRGKDIELKIERFRDVSEGWEKDKSRDRSQGRERENSKEGLEKDKSQWKESGKDAMKEREFFKVRKDEEEKETEPLVPCLRTIRADNIIIIEQERKSSDERRGRWRETERPEEENQGKRGVKMDLREILAGGGSVTEIKASEVLIIKPPSIPEERNIGGKGREDVDGKSNMDVSRDSMSKDVRTDKSRMKEKEKERPWGQATVIKDNRKDSLDDNVFVEKVGRVSQLLSKFGEMPKPPSRSKSSDNFLSPGRRKYSGDDEDDQQSEKRKTDEKNMLMKGIPKRSFSFSDRVISAKENGLNDKKCYERKMGLGKETTTKSKLGCARLLDKDRFGKYRGAFGKKEDEKKVSTGEVKKVEPIDKRAAEKAGDADGDKGFTVASIKNTEGISFARRVPIRQDGKTRAEREVKRLADEKSLEKELSVEKDSETGGQIEVKSGDKKGSDFLREDGAESLIQTETVQNYVTVASGDTASQCLAAESQYRHESAFTECSSLLCTVRDPLRGTEWSGVGPRGPYITHSVLSQHTEDLISKIEKIGDTTIYNTGKGEKAYRATEYKQEGQHYSDVGSESLIHDATPRSPKRIKPTGIPPGSLEIQIPRTVFYVAEEMVERKKTAGQSNEGQDWEGGERVERRDSWRIGKPLSRIESLREKIRQKELEKRRLREAQDGDKNEAAEVSDTQTAGDRYDERGDEIEREREASAHIQKTLVETERGQEEAAAQTSMVTFDVTEEVNLLKTCPQLPVSVAHSQAVRVEEVTSEYTTATSEVISHSSQISEDENDDPLKHVEEELRRHRSRHKSRDEESEEEENELSDEDEEVEEHTSPLDPTQSLSPSPSHPNSLAAMSRIYNLESIGSRSGLCLRERNVDISSVHLVKVKPLVSNTQQGDSKALAGEDICGVQTIQRQIEQFQLKEEETLRSITSANISLKDKETVISTSPRGVLKHPVKDNVKTQEKDKLESNYKMSPQHVCSPTSQSKQTITINTFLRGQSPDNSLKPSGNAPTPASSPCSLSPAQSPSVSPSPTPSPTLFSIRSASGGKVKRGATITISPKKNAAGSGGGGSATGSTIGTTTGPTTGSTSSGSTPEKTPPTQPQTSPAVAEPNKKRYPTVEEIEVIGGYQNLEKSCLVKNKGTPKKVKVCFDEDQLEQVCEYPSENAMLAYSLSSHDQGRPEQPPQKEEAKAPEAAVDGGATVSKSTKNVAVATGWGLKVDESFPRPSSPKLPM